MYWRSRAGGVAGNGLADVGVHGEDDQRAVQGVEFRLAGDGFQLLGGHVGERDAGAASAVRECLQQAEEGLHGCVVACRPDP